MINLALFVILIVYIKGNSQILEFLKSLGNYENLNSINWIGMDSAPEDMKLENMRCTQLITRKIPTKVGD